MKTIAEEDLSKLSIIHLEEALDAIFVDVGNGYGTPYEKLIAEMQECLDGYGKFSPHNK